MPELRIVLDPLSTGIGLEPDPGCEFIQLGDGAEVVVSGLPDGTEGKQPSMVLAFKLPSGDVVFYETSWRLFSSAYRAFLGKFGEASEAGMVVGLPDEGFALGVVESDRPFVQCGECEFREECDVGDEAEAARMLARLLTHYREVHPELAP